MTSSRRECIENLCRLFIYRQNPVIEETRNDYKHFLRPLLVDSHPIPDIGDFIENVGNKLFNSRPANMAYICIFMEFVCEVHDKIDSVTIEQLIIAASQQASCSTDPGPFSKGTHPSKFKLSINANPKAHGPFVCPTCKKSFNRGDNLALQCFPSFFLRYCSLIHFLNKSQPNYR